MEPAVSVSSAGLATGILDWYDRIKGLLKDFKPETRSMTVNFSRGTSQIRFQIVVPEGRRKSRRKIKIPAIPGYKILGTMDDSFQEQKQLWEVSGGYFVLDANKLPASERYLVDMEGTVEKSILKRFVYIKPAMNRDNDEENDKYWLESSIKQPNSLEKIYADLEIDDVNFGVEVNIDRMFGLTIPKEVKKKAAAINELLNASSSRFDRNRLLKAAMAYRRQERDSPSLDPGNFSRIVLKVTAKDLIRQHVHVDRPYDIGSIDQPEEYVDLVPQSINVHAVTRLTLATPIASGYLVFNREKYMKKLRTEFKKLI